MIKISGSHYDMGCELGQAASTQVQNSLSVAREFFSRAYAWVRLSWREALDLSLRYVPFARKNYPAMIDELRGTADGAGVPFEEIFLLNTMEEITSDALHLAKCTSLAVNSQRSIDQHVLVAHNEDWSPEDESDVFIVHARPSNGPAFLAMTYGGLLPNIGFNTAGIAQCIDSLNPNDSRVGVPRVILARAVLSSLNMSEAIRHTSNPERAAGYNHLLAHEDGEILNIETPATACTKISSVDGCAVHTNHFLSPAMQPYEKTTGETSGSQLRFARATGLLKEVGHNIQSLQEILKDHENHPDSICCHKINDPDPLGRKKTISSLVMDLTERTMLVAWGNPCQNGYVQFRMDD